MHEREPQRPARHVPDTKGSYQMFQHLVVPLDGTPFAEAALAPARVLARAFKSRILVVRAVPPAGLPRIAPQPDGEVDLERVDEADAYLHEVAANLRAAGFDAEMVLFIAEPGAGIARAAEVDHADAIVMTAHPRWKADLLDDASTTLQVLARSRVPLLAWRAEVGAAERGNEEQGLLERTESPILVPLDGSPFAEAALETAETLARTFSSYLVLVRAVVGPATPVVVPVGESAAREGETAAEREAREYLSGMQTQVERRGVGATLVVRRGTALGVIDRTWREFDASLIVMASHGNSGIASSFLGSVAAQVIEAVGAPVLVVRPAPENRHSC
jgi:nucleotide-binding universal stress UspA family protein